MKYLSHSPEETRRIAAGLADTLSGGEFLAIEGDLGAGKTTFVQGLAEALGVPGPVRSPTYAIMHHHAADKGGIRELVHLDFYRLPKEDAASALGLEEWIGRPDTVVAVEWPHAELAVPDRITVRLRHAGPDAREIEIVKTKTPSEEKGARD